jgi:hypothetical protein
VSRWSIWPATSYRDALFCRDEVRQIAGAPDASTAKCGGTRVWRPGPDSQCRCTAHRQLRLKAEGDQLAWLESAPTP